MKVAVAFDKKFIDAQIHPLSLFETKTPPAIGNHAVWSGLRGNSASCLSRRSFM